MGTPFVCNAVRLSPIEWTVSMVNYDCVSCMFNMRTLSMQIHAVPSVMCKCLKTKISSA